MSLVNNKVLLVFLQLPHLSPQTKAWITWSHGQMCWWCPSKPDPSNLLQSSRWWVVINRA